MFAVYTGAMPKCATLALPVLLCALLTQCGEDQNDHDGHPIEDKQPAQQPAIEVEAPKSPATADTRRAGTADAISSGASGAAAPAQQPTSSSQATPAPQCGGNRTSSESVSLEAARARGFDPDAMLSGLEGVYEADVRWNQAFVDPQTRVRVELSSDGTGSIIGWDCETGSNHLPSCYAGNFLTLNVRVSLSTADGRLQGSFVGSLEPNAGLISRTAYEDGIRIVANTDLSAVLGTLSLGLTPTQRAQAVIYVIARPSRETRIEVRVVVIEDKTSIRDVYALPLDGCEVGGTWIARGEPLTGFMTPTDFCAPAAFAPGSCCAHAPVSTGSRYPITSWTDSSCAAHADADAGDT